MNQGCMVLVMGHIVRYSGICFLKPHFSRCGPYGRVHNEKIDNHEITSLLLQPVGHIKVFLYVLINLQYLSPYDGNCDHHALEIMKNCALSG